MDLAVRGRDESAVTVSVPGFLIGIRTMCSLTVTQLAGRLTIHFRTEEGKWGSGGAGVTERMSRRWVQMARLNFGQQNGNETH